MAQSHLPAAEAHRILFVGEPSTAAESMPESVPESVPESTAEFVTRRLQHDGITDLVCRTATSLAQFESLLQQQTWDVIVCHYGHLPCDTADLLRLALHLRPQTPVFVVGSQLTNRETFELGRLGAQEFIEASDSQRLLTSIQQVLTRSTAALPTNDRILLAAHDSPTAQLEQILDAMQDAIMAISLPDRRLIYRSASFERVFGYPVERFIDDPTFFKQVVPAEEVEIVAAARQTALRDGFAELEHQIVFPDGRVHWLHRRAYVVCDAGGQPVQVIDTARDITASKRAQEELVGANRKQRAILASMPDLMFHIRADGIILDSHGHAGDTVVPLEALLGRNVRDFIDSPLVPAYIVRKADDAIQKVRTLGGPTIFEYTLPDEHQYEARMVPIADTDELIIIARDITERKQAEENLRRSEAYLRSLVSSQTAFNVRVDMEGKISYCNERYRRQFASVAPSLIGLASLEVVHPEDRHKVYTAVAECFADAGKIAQLEIRKGTEQSGYIWTLWEFSVVTGSDGSVQEIQCFGFDITQQKQAEAALLEANLLLEQRIRERTAELQEERNLLRTVIDAIPDFIYVKDRQHRMLLNNLAHFQSVGMNNGAELLGKTDLDLFPRAMAGQFHADEDRLFASEQPIVNLEEHGSRPDGSEAWMLTTKVPLRNIQGETVGLVGITRDISSVKAADDALRASEQRYRATVAAMYEGLVVHGKDGAIQVCNRAAEQILGLTADQIIGRTSVDPRWRTMHEDGSPFPGETHPSTVTLRTGEPRSNVVMGVYKPDDTVTWILINSRPLMDPADGQLHAVVVTFADITALKEAEATNKAALVRERELGELKSRFVSMASHEFRNPLAGILTTTESLALLWERMDKAKIDARLNRIRDQVLRLTEITDDVLQLTRLQTGRSKFTAVPGDLDELVTRVVRDLVELPGNQDRIRYDCAQRPVPAVFDARLLQQAIGNLLHNALKYSPPDKSVHIALTQTAREITGQITLRIADEGIGIPAEDLQHLFEPFHRAANVGEIQGTGLGLAIAKEGIELHGGTIAVESQVGVGTTFAVNLPGSMQPG